MLIQFCFLAFSCLAHRDENGEKIRPDPLEDPNFYADQIAAWKRKGGDGLVRKDRKVPSRVPVVFDNIHTDGNWTAGNSTDEDTCTYEEQSDGSILINTKHSYISFASTCWGTHKHILACGVGRIVNYTLYAIQAFHASKCQLTNLIQ